MEDYKTREEQRQLERERLRALEQARTDNLTVTNRKARRAATVKARKRAAALVKRMRAQGIDFIHDKP